MPKWSSNTDMYRDAMKRAYAAMDYFYNMRIPDGGYPLIKRMNLRFKIRGLIFHDRYMRIVVDT